MQARVSGGKIVKVGDWVEFKCDIEQYGEIVKITKNHFVSGYLLTVANPNGFDGDYIGGDTEATVDAEDCWVS